MCVCVVSTVCGEAKKLTDEPNLGLWETMASHTERRKKGAGKQI